MLEDLRTDRIAMVERVAEFFQRVEKLDIVPRFVGGVRDAFVQLLPLLRGKSKNGMYTAPLTKKQYASIF